MPNPNKTFRQHMHASNAYINLLRGNVADDAFSSYIQNQNLAEYTYISAKGYPHRTSSSKCRFYMTDFRMLTNEYVLVEGRVCIADGSTVENLGISTFVLSKEGNRIIVTDWYNAFGPDSIDVTYWEYSSVYDKEFWNDAELYEALLDSVSSR